MDDLSSIEDPEYLAGLLQDVAGDDSQADLQERLEQELRSRIRESVRRAGMPPRREAAYAGTERVLRHIREEGWSFELAAARARADIPVTT
jgi:hypothetical protein